jgi:hypothetical protein
MRESPEAWPTKKTFTPPPPEECKKDMLAMVKVARVRSGLWYPPSADTRAKLERVYGYVYTFLARVRKLDNFTPITARTRGTGKEAVTAHSPPAEQYREAAQAVPAARWPGRHRQGRIGRADGRDPDVRRGRVRGEEDPHTGGPAEELLESGI